MAERAGRRSQEEQRQRVAAMGNRQPFASRPYRGATAMTVVNVPAASAPAPEPKRRVVSTEALAGVKIGMSRADVLQALGEPSARFSISGDDGCVRRSDITCPTERPSRSGW
jgi:hypothetical protein